MNEGAAFMLGYAVGLLTGATPWMLRKGMQGVLRAAEMAGDLPGEAAARYWLARNVVGEPGMDGGRVVRVLGGSRWYVDAEGKVVAERVPDLLEEWTYAIKRLGFGMARHGARWQVSGRWLLVCGAGPSRIVELTSGMWDGLSGAAEDLETFFGRNAEARMG